MPLRTKLVVAVLALVIAALTLISAGSTVALHRYLIGRMDQGLAEFGESVGAAQTLPVRSYIVVPDDYMLAQVSVSGVGPVQYDKTHLSPSDLPALIKGADAVNSRVDTPFTAVSSSGIYWRMVVTYSPTGTVIQVAQRMSGIDLAITHLIWVDVLVGAGVLIALAAVGAAVVRQSLGPLRDIERTAGRIAAGDLTQRVPDPEPGDPEPQTELGRLVPGAQRDARPRSRPRSSARALSEKAARAAESSARDAAAAARSSETRAVRSEEKMRQFVADASHELRTPLTTIRGFAELYRQGAVQDPADVAQLVRRIEDEAARMGLLVEDLLLLARLDRERPLTLAPVELPVLAMDAVQAAQAIAPDRSITLEIRDEPERAGRVRRRRPAAAGDRQPDDERAGAHAAGGGGDAAVVRGDRAPSGDRDRRHRSGTERRAARACLRTVLPGRRGADPAHRPAGHRHRPRPGHRGRHRARPHGTVDVLSEPGQGATFRVTLPAVAGDRSLAA